MGTRGFAVMGFSFPAAIGTKIYFPDRKIVALCGDGGFAMNIQELETSKRNGVPVIVCVLNNRNLEYVKANQRTIYERRFISVDFSDVNFANVAKAFGCEGIRVEEGEQLDSALQKAFENDITTVIDVSTVESAEPDRISIQALEKSSKAN